MYSVSTDIHNNKYNNSQQIIKDMQNATQTSNANTQCTALSCSECKLQIFNFRNQFWYKYRMIIILLL